MSKSEIFETIVRHVREVMPHLQDVALQPSDSLRDLGANSIDRADIVIGVMEELSLEIPRIELLTPNNLGELADLIHARRG